MRYYPENEEELHEAVEKEKIEHWMLNLLKLNPDYMGWGPYEDYMWAEDAGWRTRALCETWEEFGPWGLNDLNEVVNFYFCVDRAKEDCTACDNSGLNPETKKLDEGWYGVGENKEDRWCGKLTQDEVDALLEKGRLGCTEYDQEKKEHLLKEGVEKPTAEQINEEYSSGLGHDAINKWICVRTRANRLGIYGVCEECSGSGYLYAEPEAKLGVVFWIIHPRKGCSRGVHVKHIKQEEVPAVLEYLKEAADRNANRFSGVVDCAQALDYFKENC